MKLHQYSKNALIFEVFYYLIKIYSKCKIEKVFNGKRLKTARMFRGKTIDQLASETKINKKDIYQMTLMSIKDLSVFLLILLYSLTDLNQPKQNI